MAGFGSFTESPLGAFMESPLGVREASAPSGTLYAGGQYGSPSWVKLWTGTSWAELPHTPAGHVYALAVYGDYLYAVGAFQYVRWPNTPASGIARYDGGTWTPLGSGLTGGIANGYVLAVHDGDLYIGGGFTAADGVPASNIVKWDGANFTALGSGIRGSTSAVHAICSHGGDLWVGGHFILAGAGAARNVAVWNGAAWAARDNTRSNIWDLESFDGKLYDIGHGGAGRWNVGLGAWDDLVSVFRSPGNTGWAGAGHVYDGKLFIGGGFRYKGTTYTGMILATADGLAWAHPGEMFNPANGENILTFTESAGDLIIGGQFRWPGSPYESIGMARWNGVSFSGMGRGPGTTTRALESFVRG